VVLYLCAFAWAVDFKYNSRVASKHKWFTTVVSYKSDIKIFDVELSGVLQKQWNREVSEVLDFARSLMSGIDNVQNVE
jgi:hypothetical protein